MYPFFVKSLTFIRYKRIQCTWGFGNLFKDARAMPRRKSHFGLWRVHFDLTKATDTQINRQITFIIFLLSPSNKKFKKHLQFCDSYKEKMRNNYSKHPIRIYCLTVHYYKWKCKYFANIIYSTRILSFHLPNNQRCVIRVLIRRDFQIERGGSLPNTTWRIIMRPMAWAEITPVIPHPRYGHTPEMGTDPNQHKPFWFGGPVFVSLGVPQAGYVDRPFFVDFGLGAVPDEQRFSSPFVCHALAFGDFGQVHLDLGQGQNVRGSPHRGDELSDGVLGRVGCTHATSWKKS